jgi:methylenetetrahydrofolate reductase (NADPH)
MLQSPDARFPVGAEVVTSRGVPPSGENPPPVALARELLKDPRIGWISVTDNPGGHPMLPPDWLAGQLADFSQNIVLHLACKDFNRIGLESQLWRYAAEGFENVLALSGDLPVEGFPKPGKGVFDMDSVTLLNMIRSMNQGLTVPGRGGKPETLSPTAFFPGCVVNPFKRNENELVPQYAKLLRKIHAGAAWVLPQLGYDMRKFAEIKRFLDLQNMEVPLIGNVYVLTKTAAKLFHSGKLAGCVVNDGLLAEIEKYTAGADKGKSYFREFAAKQLAVFRGLGFAAGYLGGISKPDTFLEIMDLAETFAPEDWKTFYKEIQFSQPEEFYFFDTEEMPEPNPVLKKPQRTGNINLFYRFSRSVHTLAFRRNRALYPLFRRFFQLLDGKSLLCRLGLKLVHGIEETSKHLLYGCQDCGDCALPETAYICPMARCSKNMRNGPCGGSNGGHCEAEDKPCLWTIAYDRLKYFGEWKDFTESPVFLQNAALQGTSSWRNLYLDRDHGVPTEERPSRDGHLGSR